MEPPIDSNTPRDLNHEPPTANNVPDKSSLLDPLIVLAKHKKLVLGLPFITAILAVWYASTLPPIYTATTKIFAPQQNQSATSAMMAQLGNLGGLAGGFAGGLAGIRNPNDIYIAMLRSRTVADNLIQRFDIMKSSNATYPSQARKELAQVTSIISDKSGIITIGVDDKDPKRAAELANAYVDELFKFAGMLAVTDASQRRLFFERQFAQAKDNLAKAEVTARQALAQGGIVKVDDQGRAMVETTARLRGQMTVKEVQIGAMRTFAAEANPDLRLAQQELESLKRELAKIEGTGSAKASESASGGKGIENLRLLREMKYYETIYELLARQYELAKIDEAKDSSVIQVMDKAIEPDDKSKPNRRQIVLVPTLMALIIGMLCAFLRESMSMASGHGQYEARMQALKRYLVAWR